VNDYFTTVGAGLAPALEIAREDDNTIVVKTGNLTAFFSKRNGSLNGLNYGNKRVLASGPQPDFWRAPTDNDFGNRLPELAGVWKLAGQNKTLKNFKVDKSGKAIVVQADFESNDVSSSYTITYTIADEAIKVHIAWKAGKTGLPELPRFGTQLQLSPEFETFTYYGRGPWENYSDRNTASFVGIYNSPVAEQSFDYIRPQENGNKTDVRWLTLTNKDGLGIKISGSQPLSVKAAHNTANDLDFGTPKKNAHPSDIMPRKEIYLNVDLLQRGLGGDDSWGRLPHQPYRLQGDSYEYEYEISMN
jgi:beta-galactosidase